MCKSTTARGPKIFGSSFRVSNATFPSVYYHFFGFFLSSSRIHTSLIIQEGHSTQTALLSLQPLQTGNSAVSLSSVNNCGIPVL